MKVIAIFLISCISIASFAQSKKEHKEPNVRLAGIVSATAGCEQILANPRLVDIRGLPDVHHFTITFLPKGRDIIGPYPTIGSALTSQEKEIITQLKGTSFKIVIEDIKVAIKSEGGLIRTLSGFDLNCN